MAWVSSLSSSNKCTTTLCTDGSAWYLNPKNRPHVFHGPPKASPIDMSPPRPQGFEGCPLVRRVVFLARPRGLGSEGQTPTMLPYTRHRPRRCWGTDAKVRLGPINRGRS
jgi:hypothetical protein